MAYRDIDVSRYKPEVRTQEDISRSFEDALRGAQYFQSSMENIAKKKQQKRAEITSWLKENFDIAKRDNMGSAGFQQLLVGSVDKFGISYEDLPNEIRTQAIPSFGRYLEKWSVYQTDLGKTKEPIGFEEKERIKAKYRREPIGFEEKERIKAKYRREPAGRMTTGEAVARNALNEVFVLTKTDATGEKVIPTLGEMEDALNLARRSVPDFDPAPFQAIIDERKKFAEEGEKEARKAELIRKFEELQSTLPGFRETWGMGREVWRKKIGKGEDWKSQIPK